LKLNLVKSEMENHWLYVWINTPSEAKLKNCVMVLF